MCAIFVSIRHFRISWVFVCDLCEWSRLQFAWKRHSIGCARSAKPADYSAIFNYNFRLFYLPRSLLDHFVYIPPIQIELCSFVCPPHIQWAPYAQVHGSSEANKLSASISTVNLWEYILNSAPFFFFVFFFHLETSGSIAVGVLLAFLSSCCVNIANVERNSSWKVSVLFVRVNANKIDEWIMNIYEIHHSVGEIQIFAPMKSNREHQQWCVLYTCDGAAFICGSATVVGRPRSRWKRLW